MHRASLPLHRWRRGSRRDPVAWVPSEPVARRPPVALRYRRLLSAEWLHDHYVHRRMSVREVATAAGVCEQTIYRALRRADITLRPRNRYGVPYSLEAVLTSEYLQREYVEAGRTCSDIAAELGCSVGAVAGWLRRHGIPARGVRPAERRIYTDVIDVDDIRRRLAAGATVKEVAQAVGVDRKTIHAYALA